MSTRVVCGVLALLGVLSAPWCRPALAEPRVVDLVIRGGAVAPEQRVVRVQVGDDVTLRWTSDRALTLHLHGYDIENRVVPEAPATMRFRARAAGRFPIERHDEQPGREGTVAYLEVHPR